MAVSAADCVRAASLVVVMTPWPEFRDIPADAFSRSSRRAERDRLLAGHTTRSGSGCRRGVSRPGCGAECVGQRVGAGELDEASDFVLVTGAGGFIGGHLVAELRRRAIAAFAALTSSPSAFATALTVDASLNSKVCRRAARRAEHHGRRSRRRWTPNGQLLKCSLEAAAIVLEHQPLPPRVGIERQHRLDDMQRSTK